MTTFDANVPVHKHGYVKLLDIMGSDEDIVDAARISYDRQGTSKDRALIRYLMRHRHTTPFEMAVLKFEVKLPIFVARQWMRHRMGSFNEVSARYTELPNEMFEPGAFNYQAVNNKQGRTETYDIDYTDDVKDLHTHAYSLYEEMLDEGVSREIARGVLPLNVYTKYVWKVDLHNLFHFLNLRLDPHAQQEIRDYAAVIESMVEERFPLSHEAFVDYVRDGHTVSRAEKALLQDLLSGIAVREIANVLGENRNDMTEREMKEFIEVFHVRF